MIKKQTRDLILDVTFSIIYQLGYNATGISAILKECNTPKGSLYHYFKSKKELVLAMIKERLSPKMDMLFSLEKDDSKSSIDLIYNVPSKGVYEEVFCSEDEAFGGLGQSNPKSIKSTKQECHGRDNMLKIDLAPLSVSYFKRVKV